MTRWMEWRLDTERDARTRTRKAERTKQDQLRGEIRLITKGWEDCYWYCQGASMAQKLIENNPDLCERLAEVLSERKDMEETLECFQRREVGFKPLQMNRQNLFKTERIN